MGLFSYATASKVLEPYTVGPAALLLLTGIEFTGWLALAS